MSMGTRSGRSPRSCSDSGSDRDLNAQDSVRHGIVGQPGRVPGERPPALSLSVHGMSDPTKLVSVAELGETGVTTV